MNTFFFVSLSFSPALLWKRWIPEQKLRCCQQMNENWLKNTNANMYYTIMSRTARPILSTTSVWMLGRRGHRPGRSALLNWKSTKARRQPQRSPSLKIKRLKYVQLCSLFNCCIFLLLLQNKRTHFIKNTNKTNKNNKTQDSRWHGWHESQQRHQRNS